jgi:voltage-gated potassium channel
MARGREHRQARRRRRRETWEAGARGLVAVLVFYFLVPAGADWPLPLALIGSAAALVAVGAVIHLVLREARRVSAGETSRLEGLHVILVLEIVLVGFALVYYVMAVHGVQQLPGIETRLDGLYFAVVTTTTVGFGDIVPVGQAARAVVTAHMIVNLAFIGAIGVLLRDSVRRPSGDS